LVGWLIADKRRRSSSQWERWPQRPNDKIDQVGALGMAKLLAPACACLRLLAPSHPAPSHPVPSWRLRSSRFEEIDLPSSSIFFLRNGLSCHWSSALLLPNPSHGVRFVQSGKSSSRPTFFNSREVHCVELHTVGSSQFFLLPTGSKP
jgi:hypothetical protein